MSVLVQVDSMEVSVSCKASSRSVTQETPHLAGEVRFQKGTHLDNRPILSFLIQTTNLMRSVNLQLDTRRDVVQSGLS